MDKTKDLDGLYSYIDFIQRMSLFKYISQRMKTKDLDAIRSCIGIDKTVATRTLFE